MQKKKPQLYKNQGINLKREFCVGVDSRMAPLVGDDNIYSLRNGASSDIFLASQTSK